MQNSSHSYNGLGGAKWLQVSSYFPNIAHIGEM